MKAVEDFICTADPVGVMGAAMFGLFVIAMLALGWGAEQ